MPDCEDLILARQEEIEIAEDNYAWNPDDGEELHYNPVIMQMMEEYVTKYANSDMMNTLNDYNNYNGKGEPK